MTYKQLNYQTTPVSHLLCLTTVLARQAKTSPVLAFHKGLLQHQIHVRPHEGVSTVVFEYDLKKPAPRPDLRLLSASVFLSSSTEVNSTIGVDLSQFNPWLSPRHVDDSLPSLAQEEREVGWSPRLASIWRELGRVSE